LSSVDSNDSTGVVKRARSEVQGRYCRAPLSPRQYSCGA
jgi:hypothetical protein